MKGQDDFSYPESHSPATSVDTPTLYYVPAPFHVRFSAHVIDRLFLYVFILPVLALLGVDPSTDVTTPGRGVYSVGIYVTLAIVILCAFLVLARRGQTIGKFITRCKVMRYDGTTASFFVVVTRETVGKLLSSLLAVGFIWCIFDNERRTLHDIMMRTHVVDCSKRAQDYARTSDRRMNAYRTRVKE